MIDFISVELEKISTHQVGNKLRDEGIKTSPDEVYIDGVDTKNLLLKYFLSPFTGNETFNFHNPTELGLNAVYTFCKRIFEDHSKFQQNSIEIAKHLYESSTHPKVSGGELSVCLLNNCFINGIRGNAIGLFKSEGKDIFLKFEPTTNSNFRIMHENGVNIGKLDKGCIIFNADRETGFQVFIIDSKKGNDTQYWKEDFLSIRPSSDNYHQTKSFLSITKDYVTKQMVEEFEVSKADQIDLLNRSVDYFKSHETFDKKTFENEVFTHPEMIKSFRNFDEQFRSTSDIELSDNFEISAHAVKKQSRVFKKILKLDKNFDIYIHGSKDLIEKGVENDGRKFYKIYYHEEV